MESRVRKDSTKRSPLADEINLVPRINRVYTAFMVIKTARSRSSVAKGWPLEQLSTVAGTSESPSRLIIGVSLDNGFSSLEPEVVGSDSLPLQRPKFLLYSVDLQLCKNHGRLTEVFLNRRHSLYRPYFLKTGIHWISVVMNRRSGETCDESHDYELKDI